ncbi:hypothetical protein [Polynucleobacter asymbioticus]|jgi:hypothetical protein|uniref:Uncharacterized protein n=1 Tax=Polynucleobacter asymbioticus TaxID=576611 RepID=A0AAC9IWS4_9BURK|nr:hypothetical protein [Polynucleobacter asymbioticus]APB98172.1 hypothetical protein A4F89_01885 [Polynucleobacter asymbioticus]APC00458.1 hypothetical protein AOC25_01890 [Polynucleobacter asymbioticus]
MDLFLDHLENQHCFFFASPAWLYPDSLLQAKHLWAIADQIYLRPRRHQTFSFVLPFLVCELRQSHSDQYLRLFIIYGPELSSMIGSATHFMRVEEQIKVWVTQLNFDLNLNSLTGVVNRLLGGDHQFDAVDFLRYHEPHHKTLQGHWQQVF